MMTRRTVARGFLLTTGVVAAIALAGCGAGKATAGGSVTPGVAAAGSSDSGSSAFAPVTTTTPAAPAAPAATANAGSGAAAGGGGEGAGTPQLAGGTPECKAPALKLGLGPTDGAAGTIYQALQFTNISTQNCVIVGFPGVSYVTGSNGAQVGAAAVRDGSIGSEIVLRPGAVASAVIGMTDVGVFDPSVCKPTPTLGFRVYPPDSTASLYIAEKGTGCAGNTPDPQLRVQTIKSGLGNA
jgi:hypothetical protein